jgi:catechol 2,3-dioxygenase-like lactoylglutathione lyase family enzyme
VKLKGTHHVALRTPNFEEMERFYSETLGLPVTKRWDDVRIIFIDIGSTTIELIGREESTLDTDPNGGWVHIALHVDDADAAYEEIAAKGVKMRSAPRNFKEIRNAWFYDPDGNALELVEEPVKPGKS